MTTGSAGESKSSSEEEGRQMEGTGASILKDIHAKLIEVWNPLDFLLIASLT